MNIIEFVLGMFSPAKSSTQRRPSLAIPVEPTTREDLRPYVHRAVEELGLISSSEEEWVLDLFHASQFGRSDGVSLVTRKSADQMTPEEKRAIGLKSNALMSRSYYERLTNKGRANPLGALELTIRMASFLRTHDRDIGNMKRAGCTHARARGPFPNDCKGCRDLTGKKFRIADIPSLPVTGCEEAVCSMSFEAIIKD